MSDINPARIAGGLVRRINSYVFDRDYDRRLGVETNGVRQLGELSIDSTNVGDGSEYAPVPRMTFWRALSALNIAYDRFVFIDLGSGKGRAVLLAGEMPFRRAVGVEFARELHDVATRNFASFRDGTAFTTPLEAVCMDAAAYDIPRDPCVFFMYNPFGETVMRRVVANIERSWQAEPREMCILYLNPKQAHVLSQASFLREQPRSWPESAIDRLTMPEPLRIFRTAESDAD